MVGEHSENSMQQLTKTSAFLSCDWGTTSFRLKLFDIVHGITLAEEISDKGCAGIFNEWQKSRSKTSPAIHYLLYLKEALSRLSQKTGIVLENMDIVISGMASSSIGMRELPYASLPFPIDGAAAVTNWISGEEIILNNILLISGVATHNDLMRGEETQLAGIVKMIKEETKEETIYILPGTHSKHITVTNKQIVDFKTFMTGELFGLLLHHGLLAGAVTAPESNRIEGKEITAFHCGVKKALEDDLLQNLFSVRVKDLKKYYSKTLNYFYLSGLLIGAELKHTCNGSKAHYTICSDHTLGTLYYSAFRYLGLAGQVTLLTDELHANAAAIGQAAILQKFKTVN